MQRKNHSQDHGWFSTFYLLGVLGLLLAAIPVSAAFPFVKKVTHTSTFLDTAGRADFLIYLPPGYESSEQRYSTVFYLHGSTDNAYTDTCQAAILDRLITAKTVNPMIVVYLNVTHTGGYRDRGPGDMQESFIIQDAIPFVDKTYRTLGTAEGRAIDGFSMGAAGSLRLGLSYPKLFTALMSWDGGATSADIAAIAEKNVAELKGRFHVRIYSRPPTGEAVVSETLKKLGIDYTHTIVNTDHVGVLGESGPSDKRKCNDATRVTEGWKFFSTVLAAPGQPVSIDKSKASRTIDFDKTKLADYRFYTPAGKYLGEINSHIQLPSRGLYLVQSRKDPGQKQLRYFD
ncbi:MAG: alpha/beta hydrolase-fold protein [Fibrobacteria bacterium]